jgi:hypothetical protein
MPYVITSKPLGAHKAGTSQHFSRHAVSSLRKARRYVESAVVGVQGYMAWDEPHMGPLTEAGGIVGPLPDGTVIEVEQVREIPGHARGKCVHDGGDAVWCECECGWQGDLREHEQHSCDAYNARQA